MAPISVLENRPRVHPGLILRPAWDARRDGRLCLCENLFVFHVVVVSFERCAQPVRTPPLSSHVKVPKNMTPVAGFSLNF
jgi:hypothetical protein